MPLFRSQRGSSLIEMLVGGLIALIALGAIIQIQITAYRGSHADGERFAAQAEGLLGLDRITKDIRMSTQATLTGSGITLQQSEGRLISYIYRSESGVVIRTEGGVEQVIGTQVERLSFLPEQGGRSMRVEWLARLSDGSTHLLVSKASPRVQIVAPN